jgi:uncharacterized membrane protein
MSTQRLEAFSDGVIAILITIMVLEFKIPHDVGLMALHPLLPVFLSYVLSFVYLGIYWNNHHHLMQVTDRISGGVLWANLHLLFWLSLVPFATGWMGENHVAALPAALYGTVQLMAAIAWTMLQATILAQRDRNARLAAAVGKDRKGKISAALYLAAIPLAFVHAWLSYAIYVLVASIWFVPDRRIESRLDDT